MSDATETAGVETVAPAFFSPAGLEARAPAVDASMRVGPFTVGRRLSAAPGAHFYEATDAEGAARILQVVRLRAAEDEDARAARAEEERRVARRTAELLGKPGIVLHAHGGADGADGSRLLFWALPPEEGAVPVADRPRRDVSALLELARTLATQLATRHGQDRVEPLLSEHAVVFDGLGAPRILGVPVDVADAWLAEDFAGPRRAPEEDGEALRSGDVWRLGRLLEAVSAALMLPEPVARLLEGLVRDDPARRPASGVEILGDLDGLLASEPGLMGVEATDALDPSLFPPEEVTQSASVDHVPAQITDPLAVTTWSATEWTEVEANRTPISPEDLPPVVDPDAPTRAETALDPSAPAPGPTDPAQAASPVPNWQTDPAATPTQRPEPVTDEARHAPLLGAEHAPTAEAAPEPPSDADLEVIDPEEVVSLDAPELEAKATSAPPSEAVTIPDEPRAEADAPPSGEDAEATLDEARPEDLEEVPAESDAAATEPVSPVGDVEATAEVPAEEDTASEDDAPSDAAASEDAEAVPSPSNGAGAEEGDAPDPAPMAEDEPAVEGQGAEAQDAEAMASGPKTDLDAPQDEPEPVRAEADVAAQPEDAPSSSDGPEPSDASEVAETPIEVAPPSAKPAADGAITLSEDDEVPTAVAMRGTEARADNAPKPSIDPIAAAWNQPVLPAGESPWSEVVSPRGAHRRDHSEFPGFEEDLPRDPPSDPPAPAVLSSPPAAFDDEVSPEEMVAAVSAFDPRKAVAAVLAVLVIFGLFALIARTGGGTGEARPPDVAPPANEFVLEAEPAGTMVVSAADGRILGKAPLTFLVPLGSDARVFLAAAGYEPIALDLLERGAVEAKLEPSPAEACEVELQSATPVSIEAVESPVAKLGAHAVAGAALVRAVPGQPQVGARLVRCPDHGGEAVQDLAFVPAPVGVTIRITEPAGAAAYVDGEPVGRVPTTAHTERAFVEVRVDDASGMSVSRWVPVRGPLEVRMPAPKPRRRPRLVVPDTRPGDADDPSAMGRVEPAATKAAPLSAGMKRRVQRLKRAGRRHLEAGRTRRASRSYRECLRIAPDEAVCHRGLGHLYRRIGRADKARRYYQRYLELRPEASDAERIRAFLAE